MTGIRKHGEELLNGITKVNNKYEIVLFVNEKLEKAFKEKFPGYKIVVIKLWMGDIKFIKRINFTKIKKMSVNKIIRQENCDIMLYPYVNNYTSIIDGKKKIITIMDVIPLDEIEDKETNKYQKIKDEFLTLMNKTQNLVTLSTYSKKRLLEINPNYKGEITVISDPVDIIEKSKKDIKDVIKSNNPYIFSINSFYKHKNQITLLKAFDKIKNKIPNYKLVLVRKTRT